MPNPFDDVARAIEQARETRRACDAYAERMAELLVDSLRSVSAFELRRIKRRLRDFDAVTGKWRRA